MTHVACWFDDGLSPHRIVMVADSRATFENGKILYTDDVLKLFHVEMHCRNLPLAAAPDDEWPTYYSTKIVIGFSGVIVEAMTIVEWLHRHFRRLVAQKGAPRPTFCDIANTVCEVVSLFRSRRKYKPDGQLQFLVSGFCPTNAEPYAAMIECAEKSDVAMLIGLHKLQPGQPWMIGDISGPSAVASCRLQDRIQKKRAEYEEKHRTDIDADVEAARRGHVLGKQLEQELIEAIRDEFKTSVGGPIDKLELVLVDGRGVADVTGDRDSSTLSDLLRPMAGGHLERVPLVEKFGRK